MPGAERELVLRDLNLPMLFLDAGAVSVYAEPRWSNSAGSERHLDAAIETAERLSSLNAAAILCRVLLNPLVSHLTLERKHDELFLRSSYALSSGAWTIDLSIPITSSEDEPSKEIAPTLQGGPVR